MKMTVEIPDSLARKVRRIAAREGVPLKLRRASLRAGRDSAAYPADWCSQPAGYAFWLTRPTAPREQLRGEPWDKLRAQSYEGRGGSGRPPR